MKRSSKRGNNEGTIYLRSDGRWTAAVTVGGGRVKQRRKYLYGRTRQEVAKKLTDAMKIVSDGIPMPSEKLIVASFAETWLGNVKVAVREKTYLGYESIVRVHLVPSLGSIAIAK